MEKQNDLVAVIEEYRENFKLKSEKNKYPDAIPLISVEYENMIFLIRQLILKYPEDYYLMEEEDEPILKYKNSDLYINPESELLRASIRP